ncbi:hypothetical protein VRY54_02620 [Actinomyces sp. F1_1611]
MRVRRAVAASTMVGALVLGTAAAAQATPVPDRGPNTGGTAVTIEAPKVSFTSVSAGVFHTVAIADNGRTYAWGDNEHGEIGDGSSLNRSTPVEVATPEGVTFTSISAGAYHSIAIGDDGKTYAWGDNSYGQLGDGSKTDQPTPVEVAAPEGVSFTSISAGGNTSIAIGNDGKTYAWGSNGYGTIGDGSQTDQPTPVEVAAPEGVTFTSISAGGFTSVAIGNDGKTYAWGYVQSGNPDDQYGMYERTPVEVTTPEGVTFTSISAGNLHSLAIGDDGKTYAWGYGQLSDGSSMRQPTPVEVAVPAGVTFTSISTHFAHSLAIGNDGKTYAWGPNQFGQLGDASWTDQPTPVEVAVPAGVTFTSVATGGFSSFALGEDGKTYAWGWNQAGQLGDGTVSDRSTPVEVVSEVALTGIMFDGLAGTTPGDPESTIPVDNGDGTWSIVTPAHAPGPVDVVVSWTLNGIAQTPITYPGGFTYYTPAAPTITNPADQRVTEGDPAEFTVTTSGEPAPVVTWEASRDGGQTWVPVTEGISSDGLTLMVASSVLADSGTQYRATAANTQGEATSAPATLTVNPIPLAPTITNPTDQMVTLGDSAEFTITAGGTPTPEVVWEVSRNGGTTWEAIRADPDATPSSNGWTLRVVGTTTNNGYLYRAIATNSAGQATSAPAKLTVTTPTGSSNSPDQTNNEVTKELAVTGNHPNPLLWITGLTALILGAGLITANRTAKHRLGH